MAVLIVREPTIDGVNPSYVPAAGGGDEVPISDDNTVLSVRNASGASITATAASTAGTEPGIAPANKVVTIPAGEERDIRFKPYHRFVNVNGRVAITYSAVTTVTVTVRRVA